jgi:putative inorganic carbon (HCO3(-)) transporter
MIGMVFTKIINNIRDDKFKVIFIVLFGYVVQANFNISVISVAPLFWIILGIGSNSEIIKKID